MFVDGFKTKSQPVLKLRRTSQSENTYPYSSQSLNNVRKIFDLVTTYEGNRTINMILVML